MSARINSITLRRLVPYFGIYTILRLADGSIRALSHRTRCDLPVPDPPMIGMSSRLRSGARKSDSTPSSSYQTPPSV